LRIISRRKLREFWEEHSSARDAIESWYAFLNANDFVSPNQLRKVFNHVDFIGDGICIFNIKGNDFRLITHMMYQWNVVFILWIGTHADYDKLSEGDIKNLKKPK
tara:strand:+ start:69 stop:383 length:315 start_codon:yes stop_codon:yes gene_type:complete